MYTQACLTPIDIPTRETADFLSAVLPPPARILEVGCGEGDVALELVRRGYQVIGVDADEETVASARQRGVEARLAEWPAFDAMKVDMVAFTRSLHHIHDLDAAVAGACERLIAGGCLMVEDFAFDETDEPTIAWFVRILRSTRAQALLNADADAFAMRLWRAADPVSEWHSHHHHHEVHSISALTAAVAQRTTLAEVTPVPYLYRYLVPTLPPTPEATAFVAEVFDEELRLGDQGRILLIGRRLQGRVDARRCG